MIGPFFGTFHAPLGWTSRKNKSIRSASSHEIRSYSHGFIVLSGGGEAILSDPSRATQGQILKCDEYLDKIFHHHCYRYRRDLCTRKGKGTNRQVCPGLGGRERMGNARSWNGTNKAKHISTKGQMVGQDLHEVCPQILQNTSDALFMRIFWWGCSPGVPLKK